MSQQNGGVKRATLAGWLVCALGAIFYSYEYLLRVEPSVMSNELMSYYGIGYEGFGLLVGFYYTAYTPMQLLVGMITDLYGPRRVLTTAVAFCALGSYMFAMPHTYFSPNTYFYIACTGRFMVGFGSAFAFVGVLKLAVIWLPANRFALFSGLATALGMVGAMIGDTEIMHLSQTIGWLDTILYSASFGVMLIPVLWLLVRDKHDDLCPKRNPRPTFQDVFSGLAAIAKNPQIWISGSIALCFYCSLAVFGETWGVQFLVTTYGLSQKSAAHINAAVFAGWLVGAPLMGLISDQLRNRKLPIIAGAILSLCTLIIFLYYPNLSPNQLLTMLFLYGVFCSAEVICFSLGRENAPDQYSASAIAFINMLTMVSGMVLQPLVGILISWSQHNIYIENILSNLHINNFQFALFILPLGTVIILLLTMKLRETHAKPFKEA